MRVLWDLTGPDLRQFYDNLGVDEVPAGVYRLRIGDDDGALKVKANEWTWSPEITTAPAGEVTR